MINSQSASEQEDHPYHQEEQQLGHEIVSSLQKNITSSIVRLEEPLVTATTAASIYSESDVYRRHRQLTPPNHDNNSGLFSFNDLTAALQQEQIPASSLQTSLPSSSASIFATAAFTNNNNNNSHNNTPSSSNRFSSVSPPSSRSSSSTLNLGISLNGSSTRISDHFHLNLHPHTTPTSRQFSMNQSHPQQNSSSMAGGDFSLVNSSGGSNSEHYLHQQSSQMQMYQQQQQSSAPHHQLQRSISSTSSSIGSPTSMSQQQQHQQLQQLQTQSPTNPSASSSKSCWCFGGDATYHFKTLVPAVAAGAIIGKGGETIASLQRDTGARVKMSKTHDFYPGTSERVCLITGSIDAIMTVLDFIMDKIREKPDLTTKLTDIEAKQAQERDKQVKILVPNSTAGMIIGKAGAYIKQIKEESGSYVQISQKPKDITLQERCITIIGEKENNKIACKMILAKIVEDPQSGTCLNVSYADVNGPVANYNPTGSPYATNQNAISSSTASLNSALGTTVSGAGILVNSTGINLSFSLGTPSPTHNPALATQLLETIKVAMRGMGYSETVTAEVCTALGVLAKYGVLGVGVGLPHTNGAHSAPVSYLGVSALEPSAAAATAAAAGSVFGALGQVNLEQYINQSTAAPRPTLEAAAAQFDPFRHAGSQAATPISINNNSFGLAAATTGGATAQALGAQTLGALSKSPTPGDLGAKDSKNVEIPEVIVGAILGPSGRSLVEIQHMSGANIQISKKGIFAPGTRNRIVTITGQPNAIAMAQFYIEQKINEEKAKRACQNTLTNVVQ